MNHTSASASDNRSKLSQITQKLKDRLAPAVAQARTDEKHRAYASWLEDFRTSAAHCLPVLPAQRLHLRVLLCCAASTEAALLERTHASLAAQTRPADQVDTICNHQTPLWQQVPEQGWTLLLHAGDTLEPQALFMLERTLVDQASADTVLLYCDHDEWGPDGQPKQPRLKPALNVDLLRSLPYMGRALVLKNAWGQAQLGEQGLPDLADAYHCALQASVLPGKAVLHLPLVLLHLSSTADSLFTTQSEMWQRLAQVLVQHLQVQAPAAEVLEGPGPGTFHVLYPLERTPLVSIVIPTKDLLPFLNRCIDSLLSQTDYPAFEILLVDNDSQTPEAREFLAGLSALGSDQIRVLSAPGPFNLSRLNNLAVAQARGEFVLLLNNDTAVLQADWLSQMVRHGLRDGVGVVGARLLYPDTTVQHAGIIMGLGGPADHPLLGLDNSEPGYMFRAQVAQNFSAVASACLLVRKSVYEAVGGMDEATFGVSYSSMDFCLRVGQTGQRIVWTPLATLLHESGASQKAQLETISPEQKTQRFQREQAAMYQRWPHIIANDPAYNPNLSLIGTGYEVESNRLLRFDHFPQPLQHKVAAFHADVQGCGHYRIIQPMQAMLDAGLCRGGVSPEIFSPNLALRSGADILVFQRPNTEIMLAHLKALTALKNVRKIYEVDDHLSKVPVKSAHYDLIPRDLRGKMLKAIGLCDRLVVSTEALAHELGSYNDDVRVVPNRLAPAMWGATPPQRPARSPGQKPRIGWAGGISHQGDLEMVAAVIRDLADQVDWVFMGMCPDNIRPYIKEFVPGVPTLEYPAKLMALTQDWDLAIAPVESNAFNECKSNLKLLEYGWCGVPVVCSDVTPYHCDLAVSRVKNRYKDWRDAILERVSDLSACHRDGLTLQAQVAQNWRLTGQNLQDWYQAWTS
ncbi:MULTISPECIES: glycosyltransferase [Giesbergeria]|uniref:Glycosyltransferase n=1 Tax=Giesbergeria sinuosa TaxID=80883 RepID=A0ABV9QFN7_9BURK